jgi:hypothetical protein
MKNIIITICSIFVSLFSAYTIKPKLCIDCKFFIKDHTDDKFGKCVLFPKRNEDYYYNDYFLVNGIETKNKSIEYHFCATSRQFDKMCGKEGKFYEAK